MKKNSKKNITTNNKKQMFFIRILFFSLLITLLFAFCNKQITQPTTAVQQNNAQQDHDNLTLNGQGMILVASYLSPNPANFFYPEKNTDGNWGYDWLYDPTNVVMSDNSITLYSKKLSTPVTAVNGIGTTGTYNYSSDNIDSHNLMTIMQASANQPHGYIEMVASLPIGPNTVGSWPAFWLMPQTPGYRWPYGMEIDIMECYGVYYPSQPVTSTIHFSKINGGTNEPIHASNGNGGNASLNQLHSYGLEWNVLPNQVTLNFYFDRNIYSTIVLSANSSNAQIVDGYNNYMASYNNQGWYVILSTGLGLGDIANWNNNIVNAQTAFPLTYQINQLNVYTVN